MPAASSSTPPPSTTPHPTPRIQPALSPPRPLHPPRLLDLPRKPHLQRLPPLRRPLPRSKNSPDAATAESSRSVSFSPYSVAARLPTFALKPPLPPRNERGRHFFSSVLPMLDQAIVFAQLE